MKQPPGASQPKRGARRRGKGAGPRAAQVKRKERHQPALATPANVAVLDAPRVGPKPGGLRILLASAEVHPYSKTGGLADMVAALGKSLAQAGHQVGLVTPLYRGVRERLAALEPLDWRLELPLADRLVPGSVWISVPRDGLSLYFVDQPDFFQRPQLYREAGVDYPDNPERFGFLCKAVVNLARYLPWKPELVHVHDWHVGMVPLLILDQAWRDGWASPPRTCLTVHNLAYQGVYGPDQYPLFNLPWYYYHSEGIEFHGSFSFLKAAIAHADALTTVSPRYAQEITTPELGCGLDGILRARQSLLTGILNGADYEEWRTVGNPFLPHAYSLEDLAGKTLNKLALQRQFGLPERAKVPLFGMVTRLAEQKGVEVVLAALPEVLGAEMQFVLLGFGEPPYERAFTELARRYPAQVAVSLGYDTALSHRIEAGSDFFLMPSRFEPCGLNQMYSQRFGAIPVVRATGGLDDSVVDLREDPFRADGIKFHDYSPAALVKAIRKALALFREADLLRHFQRNAMKTDFSWERTTARYEAVYRKVLGPAG